MSLSTPLDPRLETQLILGPMVDWAQASTAVANLITFMCDEPPASGTKVFARGRINGAVVRFRGVRAGGINSAYPAGTVIRCDGEVWVQAGTGHVILDTVMDLNGEIVPAAEFFAATGLSAGNRFDVVRTWSDGPDTAARAA